MKPSFLHLTLATLVMAFLFLFAVTPATAEEGGAVTKVIKSVNATANTVDIEFTRGEKTMTKSFTVSATTTITVNNSTGTLDQVKPGMVVSAMTKGSEEHSLTSLTVADK